MVNFISGNNSSGKKKKHKLLQRNFASGSVMKSKKKKTNIFGSKGVSHAIKKPKKIIVQPKKKVSICIKSSNSLKLNILHSLSKID